MRSKLLLCLAIYLSFTSFIFAQEEPIKLKEVIITASRIKESTAEVASSVTVITAKELKEKGITTVMDALREVPGVHIVQTGTFGGPAVPFVRGGGNGQALIMIDGVPVWDAMGVSRGDASLLLSYLQVEQIDRIEVVRGPQSVLYGSNAMTGAINIITKKGIDKPKVRLFNEGGTYSTFREGMEFSGISKNLNYALTFSRLDTNGTSQAVGYPERDSYRLNSFSSRIKGKVTDKITIGAAIAYNDADTGLDYYFDSNTFTLITDASGYKQKASLFSVNTYYNHQILPFWKQRLLFSYTRTDKDFVKDKAIEDYYNGELRYISWQHQFELKPVCFLAGFDYQQEIGYSKEFAEKRQDEKAWFLETIFKRHSFYFSTGIRYNRHQTAGDKVTYRLSGAYTFPTHTKLHGSFGTGFRAPSLYQLYGVVTGLNVGNPNLTPEKSQGYDFGITQSFFNRKIEADITYFFNWFKDLITYDYPDNQWWLGKYQNVATAHTEGVEFSLNIMPISWLKLSTNYTWLDAKDTTTNTWLPRRPKHKISSSLFFLWKEKADFSLTGIYFGKRFDSDNNQNPLGGYFIVNLAARYYPTSYLTLSLRIQNLLDRDYEEVKGYSGCPFMALLGAEFKWGL